MVAFTILAGGYDLFIATYLFNSQNFSLALVGTSPTGPSPSWISFHPTNKTILYAVNEVAAGALQSYDVSAQGTLSNPINTIASGGASPAFAVALSTGQVAVMNYNGGNGRIIPTITPETFDTSAPIITFPLLSSGISHPHMVLEHGQEILVPDLGGDIIWRLTHPSGSQGNFQIVGSIPQPKGSGPRHIAIYDNRLFTLHELASTLGVQKIPSAPNGTSSIIAIVSTAPPNPPAGAVFAAAEILIPAPTAKFPKPYIYVSNRNRGVIDPRGDSIAIFEHVDQGTPSEGLKLIRQVYTGLDQVRGMEFGPSDRGGEEFLIASGFAGSGGVLVYRRTAGGRNLKLVAKNLEIPTRTTFVWV